MRIKCVVCKLQAWQVRVAKAKYVEIGKFRNVVLKTAVADSKAKIRLGKRVETLVVHTDVMERSQVNTITGLEQTRQSHIHHRDAKTLVMTCWLWRAGVGKMCESLIRVGCALTGDGSAGSSESHRLTLYRPFERCVKGTHQKSSRSELANRSGTS